MKINFTKLKVWPELLLSVIFLFVCSSVFAQSRVITGKVTDGKDNTTLIGVSIRIKGTTTGSVTGTDGTYRLSAATGSTLIFKYIGYDEKEIVVSDADVINVSLQPSAKDLSEVVVIGYGSRRKKDITSAISSVKAEELEKSTALSPELALQGRAAGVSVTSAGGDPSARPTVRIRGVSSFNSADPLYVIDGIPIAEGGAGTTFDNVNDPTRRTGVNIYTLINPNDIESISVLKDASAAAIYGVRAANGVILVTTKSGKKGRARVDFDMSTGVQKIPKVYDVLNTQQYVKFYTDVYNANPQVTSTGAPVPIGQADFFGPVWDPNSTTYLGNSATYDWQHALINNKASIKNYNLRVSGGTDIATYNFSGGYASNDAPFKDVNTERYSFSSNTVSKIGKYLEGGINIRLVQEYINQSLGAGGGTTTDLSVFRAAPWQPIYDTNNKYGFASLYKLNQPITPTTFDYSQLYGNRQYVAIGNALGAGSASSNKFTNQTVLGNVYIQLNPIAGLKVKASYSGQQYTIANKSFNNFDTWQYSETPSNPYGSAPASLQLPGVYPNGIGVSTSTTQNTIKALNADYSHSFGKHNIGITLDASQQKYNWVTTSSTTGIQYSDPALQYFNATGVGTATSNSLNGVYSLIGYLARFSYNYNSKYYLEGVVRRDGSSRFAHDRQFGTFPSGSLAYRITEEDFMKGISWLNDLKIRGGYGVLGNEQTTGGFKYSPIAGVNPPSYNLGSGQQTNNLGINFPFFPNFDLTWEKAYKTSAGFDASLFNNSVSLTVEYYNNVTKGIIQSIALTPSSGIQGSADLNIANVLNRGFEFQIGYNRNIGKVGINLSANLTTVHNEVLKLRDHQANRGIGLEEGQPIGFIYGYKVDGIFQNQAEVDAWKASHTDVNVTAQAPGDMYFKDLYGQPTVGSTELNKTPDGKIDANDQTYLGKTIPGYYYGFSLGANYKGFDVAAFFQGVGDVQKYNFARAAGEGMNGYGRNQWTSVLNAWTAQNPSTTMPRAVFQDPAANTRFSSRFVESAAYLRFQNLQIGYSVPKSILEKTRVFENLRIFFSGVNLFTVTNYTGLDPENDNYPSTRQYLFGIKAGF